MRNNFLRLVATLGVAVGATLGAFGYDLIYQRDAQNQSRRVTWDAGSIPFVIRMSQTANLQDGTSYATSVQAAMNTWNSQITQVQFTSSIAASGLANDGDGVNEIAFDTQIYSNSTDPNNPPQDFGTNTLAVTLSWTTVSPRSDGTYRRTQSDILFNSKWNWNSYRGGLQQPEDIRRVAVHELGHVLGLDHPDQDGQSVTAIMNAYVSDIDSLQTDDLTGAQLLYGRPGGFSAPGNDNFASATTITLSNNSANLTASSVGATAESGEPHHGHSNDGASVWWKWTASSNGTLTINTLGSNFDTVLAAYTGGSVSSLTQLAANDDTSDTERRSTITINVTNGTTYYIAVAGWDAQWGAVVLNLSAALAADPPIITQQPLSATVLIGTAAQFSVGVSSSVAYSLQWQMAAPGSNSWNAINSSVTAFSGAASSTLTVAANEVHNYHGYTFRCVATNSGGSVASDAATLLVNNPAPVFVRRPPSVQTTVGSPIRLYAFVNGAGPMTCVWRRNGVVIPNASDFVFDIASASEADSGWYDLTVTNYFASARTVFRVNVSRPHSTPIIWGDFSDGQNRLPSGLGAVGAVAAGTRHALALTSYGTVMAWGSNFYQQTDVPPALSHVVAVSAGISHSLALKDDGTVVAWGDTLWGQAGPAVNVPSNLNNVVAIAAGWGRNVALRADGTVVNWGTSSGEPRPTNLTDVVSIAAGAFHFLALRADGSVVGWGENGFGEITVPAGLSGVKAIAAGGSAGGGHSLALKTDGTVVAWGNNGYGQCNVPAGLSNVVAIAAGGHFSLAQKADGTIVSWGDNSSGQLNVPSYSLQGLSPGFEFAAALTVAEAPTLLMSTASQAVNVGDGVKLSVGVSGLGPFTFQWKRNGAVIADGHGFSGATTNTLIITNVTLEMAGTYTVEVTSAAGTFVSRETTLIVGTPPGLSARPLSRVVEEGQSADFSIQAIGAGPFTYVWRHNRRLITGATGPTLSLTNVRAANAGIYEVLITGADGGISRSVFMLRVAVSSPTLRGWGDYSPIGNTTVAYSGSLAGIWGGGSGALALRGDGHVVAIDGSVSTGATPPSELSDAVGVAVGGSHGAAVRSDGTVQCWGDNTAGQTAVPAGLKDVVAVSADQSHTIALKSDGTLVGWGTSTYGQHLIPAGLKNVIAVETGRFDTTALLADGTVVQWGMHAPNGWLPPTAVDLVAIAGGESHTLGLKADGTVIAWGADYAGSTAVPPSLTNVVAIAAGQAHSIALKGDGTVVGWGRDYEHEATPPAGITAAFGLAAHGWWSAALGRPTLPVIRQQPSSQGVLLGSDCTLQVVVESIGAVTYQWRKDQVPVPGATGADLVLANIQSSDFGGYDVVVTNDVGSTISEPALISLALPPVVSAQPNSAAVYAGESVSFAVAVTSNAPVQYQWMKEGAPIAGAVSAVYRISQITLADGGTYSVVVSNIAGNVVSAGAILTVSPSSAPVITQQPQSKTVAFQAATTFAVAATGAPSPTYQWQRLPTGLSTWVDVDSGINQFYSGEATPTLHLNGGTLLANNDDKFRCIVSNVAGSVTSAEATLTITTTAAALLPTGGYTHAAFVRVDGTLWAMGRNQEGQLGDGTVQSHLAPVKVLTSVAAASAGANHLAILKTDGTLWATGYNPYGALGTGSVNNYLSAPQLMAAGVSRMATGVNHTAFVKTDGTLWTTGWNSDGQLGDGTIESRASPIQVASDVIEVGAGNTTTMFIKSDGTLWGTGNNSYGQFGDGTTVSRTVAVQVGAGVKAVALGYDHSLLLSSDGTLRASGHNGYGQLGNGTMADAHIPVAVATDVLAVAAGDFHSVFLKRDGTVWGTGANNRGQLGDYTTVTRATPIQLASDAVAIGAGFYSTYIVKADGTLWAAGANEQGQLGDGSTTDRTSFVQIAAGGSGLPGDYTDPTATNSASAIRVAIAWPHSRGALYYRIWRHTANNSAAASLIADRVVGNLYPDVTATAGVDYYYWVQPVNQFGELSVGASALGRWGIAGLAPSITAQPVPRSVSVGASTTFTVTADGTAPLSYQWRKDGSAIDGATAASYTITSTQIADAGSYHVVVHNDYGSATSSAAALTVNKLDQTITFAVLPDVAFSTTPIILSASASSNLAVTFSIVSGPATVNGTALALTGVGSVTVRASQPGDDTHAAATSIDRAFTVTPTFDSWLISRFTAEEIANAAVSGPNADPDGDGLANLVEYALGTDPRADSSPSAPLVSATAIDWTFTYARPADRTDVTYTVEYSTNLTTWSSTGVTHTLVSTGNGIETWRATYPISAAPTCFLRLVVTR